MLSRGCPGNGYVRSARSAGSSAWLGVTGLMAEMSYAEIMQGARAWRKAERIE